MRRAPAVVVPLSGNRIGGRPPSKRGLIVFPRSIRARLTMWYTLVLGGIVTSFAIGSLLLDRELSKRRADRFLRDAALTFAEEVATETASGAPLAETLQAELKEYRFREIDFFVFAGDTLVGRSPVRDSSHQDTEAEDVDLDVARLVATIRLAGGEAAFTVDDEEGGFRVATSRIEVASHRLVVAAVQSWHGYAETQELITLAYSLAIPLLLLLSAGSGYWLASKGLAPVAAMSREAAQIGRDNISVRLVASNPRDEIGELAAVFNEMLERLASAFAQQERFLQDASHELRSPVTAVRMEADVSLQQPHRPEAQYRESLSTIRRAALRLGRIVDDLFLLARFDARRLPVSSERIDLGEAVHDAVKSVRSAASDRNIRLQLADTPDAPVRGRSADVERIVVNLVDNAVKYAPSGSTVSIVVTTPDQHWFVVRVFDEGPGIPPAVKARIFERFYRGTAGGDGRVEGAGLGLPIARALAESLGGRLDLEEMAGTGACFAFWIPRDES